jgi:hypothetical protein
MNHTLYIIEVQPNKFLQDIGGGWGPSTLSTKEFFKAARFSTPDDARRWIRSSNWGQENIIIREIQVQPEKVTLLSREEV